MCLAVPAKVIDIDGIMATVDAGGVQKVISLAMVDNIAVNDYVIVHAGYAVNRIDPDEAALTLQLLQQIAHASGVPWPQETT